MSWQERTGARDRDAAAAHFRGLGMTVDWAGERGDELVAWNVQPAVVRHPVTGERLWFNLAQHPAPGEGAPRGRRAGHGTPVAGP
jgi:hypothetical protein